LGIDDYIAKPFDKREVNARIRMVMRRFGWTEEECIERVEHDRDGDAVRSRPDPS